MIVGFGAQVLEAVVIWVHDNAAIVVCNGLMYGSPEYS